MIGKLEQAVQSGPPSLVYVVKLIYLLALISIAADSSGAINGTSSIRAADRIRNEPESVWVEFVQLGIDHKPLNLGQGFPDFAAPQVLMDALGNTTRQLDDRSVLMQQYTRPFGHPRLIRALRAYYEKYRGFSELQRAEEQILVTVGAYEALYVSIMAFVSPGDRVLIIEPAFDAYAPMVAMAGGSSVFIPLRMDSQPDGTHGPPHVSSSRFGLNMSEFEEKIAANGIKTLILNTPNNPLGKVFSADELRQVSEVCRRHDLLVIADEVYEQFYYGDAVHVSIASLPGMWNRTITIGSAGKTFSVTGWKIGWALGPSQLIRYLQLVHQTAVYTVATPLQEAVAQMFEHEMATLAAQKGTSGAGYWAELRRELEQKRDRMAHLLAGVKLRPVVAQGGYFMFAHFGGFLAGQAAAPANASAAYRSAGPAADFEFARWLVAKRGLLVIPGSAFYSAEHKHLGAGMVRFCFIKSWPTLAKLERLIEGWPRPAEVAAGAGP